MDEALEGQDQSTNKVKTENTKNDEKKVEE